MSLHQQEKSKSDSPKQEEETKPAEKSVDKDIPCDYSSNKRAAAQDSSSKETDNAEQQQGASASQDDPASGKGAPAKDSSKNWI